MGRTFVDDEHLGPHPTGASLLILPNSVSELFRFLPSEANTRKGMNGHPTDITRGDAYVILALRPGITRTNVPVEAVTATASGTDTNFLRRVWIICLNKTDFPVPALPV
jgi:hypothetical protein